MYSKYFPALAGQMVESNFPTSSGTRGEKPSQITPSHPDPLEEGVFLSADVPMLSLPVQCCVSEQ